MTHSEVALEGEFTVEESRALAVAQQPQPIAWVPTFALAIDEAVEKVEAKHSFFKRVMRSGDHYGVIPGTGTKPALLKPGAELLLSSMGLYVELSDAEAPLRDYDGNGAGNGEALIAYRRVCKVYRQTGPEEHMRMCVAQAQGYCTSRESKYRYRNAQRVCPKCGKAAIIKGKAEFGGGWVCFKKKDGCGANFKDNDASIVGQEVGKIPNPDIADQENTILKMADKRALVAAALLATGCSDIFTQDIEEDNTFDDPQDFRSDPPPAAPPKTEAPKESVEQSVAQLKARLKELSQTIILTPIEVTRCFSNGSNGKAFDINGIKSVGMAKAVIKALEAAIKEASEETPL